MAEKSNTPKYFENNHVGEDKDESFTFEPIKGYPMLSWKGKRPFTSTHYYPAQIRESYGDAIQGWMNQIYWGDNLQVMSHLLKDYRGGIDLIYIDPPFDSKALYRKKISLHGSTLISDANSFEEKQYTDIWNNDEYLQFMYERLIMIRNLLSNDGSLYVHLDYRMDSYIRIILDEIFGKEMLRNEIIWSYATGGASKEFFARKHDTILFYTKSSEYKFYPDRVREQRTEKSLARAQNPKGARIASDNLLKLPTDVWEIAALNPMAVERVDYPTQKPIELLEKIILASSNPGDIVFDCFMGSGTTLEAALRLGRRFIGSDINQYSVQTTVTRLLKHMNVDINTHDVSNNNNDVTLNFQVSNVNSYDIFKNPIEAKEKLMESFQIQSFGRVGLFDGEREGRMVKIMPVNRITTRADLSDLITGLDYKAFERRKSQDSGKPVEMITLVCMGHEPDLAAYFKNEVLPYQIDVEVVDILRDRQDLLFKRDSEAKIKIVNGELLIDSFYPMNLLQKLSVQKENVNEWRELVESIMIDWNYDGAVFQPSMLDIPNGDKYVNGRYLIPADAGNIKIKITDILSDSFEWVAPNV